MLINFSFHHLGYATNSIEKTVVLFQLMGYVPSEKVTDTIQNVNIVLLSHKNSPFIELVEPIGDNSPVVNIIRKNGVTPYHICYEVEDINKAIYYLRKQGFISIFNPVPAVVFGNRLICYLYNKNIGLIELVNI